MDTQVLFIIPNLTYGGIQTQVGFLAAHLAKKKCQVRIVGLYNYDTSFVEELMHENIEIEFSPELGNRIMNYHSLSLINRLNYWYYLIGWLKSKKAVVILPYSAAIDDHINTVWRCTRAKKSFTFERGGHFQPKKQKTNWIRLVKKISSPIYVANSYHGANALATMRGINPSKVTVIRNGYVPRENTDSVIDWDDQWSNKVVFVCVANFFDQKDHQFLLNAWKIADLQNSVLLLIGMGRTESCIRNYNNAKYFVLENHLQDRVFFIGSTSATQLFLQKSDVGVLSSVTEGCPNAVLEYMGASLPVMSRNIPGVMEVISETNKSLLTDIDNVQAFATQLILLEKDKELRERLGVSNLCHVQNEFRMDSMLLAYERLILD